MEISNKLCGTSLYFEEKNERKNVKIVEKNQKKYLKTRNTINTGKQKWLQEFSIRHDFDIKDFFLLLSCYWLLLMTIKNRNNLFFLKLCLEFYYKLKQKWGHSKRMDGSLEIRFVFCFW